MTTTGAALIFAVQEVSKAMSERRKAWRTGLVLDVWYEGEGVRGETRISDLSVRGAYIEAASPLPVGTIFNVTFALPDGTVIETQATVAHSHPGSGMGVRFDSLTREQTNIIRQFIHA
ncbi:MAG: PilZ domain-containing protein [Blastocatellia bacterium]